MNQRPLDPLHERILEGTAAAALIAIERARQTGTPLVVWRDGKVQEISPDDPSLSQLTHSKT